jgi:hypothetical protein
VGIVHASGAKRWSKKGQGGRLLQTTKCKTNADAWIPREFAYFPRNQTLKFLQDTPDAQISGNFDLNVSEFDHLTPIMNATGIFRPALDQNRQKIRYIR